MTSNDVPFPVRAGLVTPQKSRVQLGRLMTETIMLESKSFTVWSAPHDPVDMKTLMDWIQYVQAGHVYLDLPFDLAERPTLIPDPDHLQSSSSSTTKYTLLLLLSMAAISMSTSFRVELFGDANLFFYP